MLSLVVFSFLGVVVALHLLDGSQIADHVPEFLQIDSRRESSSSSSTRLVTRDRADHHPTEIFYLIHFSHMSYTHARSPCYAYTDTLYHIQTSSEKWRKVVYLKKLGCVPRPHPVTPGTRLTSSTRRASDAIHLTNSSDNNTSPAGLAKPKTDTTKKLEEPSSDSLAWPPQSGKDYDPDQKITKYGAGDVCCENYCACFCVPLLPCWQCCCCCCPGRQGSSSFWSHFSGSCCVGHILRDSHFHYGARTGSSVGSCWKQFLGSSFWSCPFPRDPPDKTQT